MVELLREEIRKFEVWVAAEHPDSVFGWGEWEADYSDWEGLYLAALPLLRAASDWSDEEIGLLLYVIARDNETMLLAAEVPKEKLVKLAKAALVSEETHAKWQLVGRMESLPFGREVEDLLLQFAADRHEYVRRRALLALAEHRSVHAERLAEQAWATGDEYQRMAALRAFFQLKSPLLRHYLKLAVEDGRQYLTQTANRISQGEGEYTDMSK